MLQVQRQNEHSEKALSSKKENYIEGKKDKT